MSSMAPRTTVPCATREAASVPALVIHSIIRPPWICPGPPACSGKTHSIISTAVSAMEGMCQDNSTVAWRYRARSRLTVSRRWNPVG